ncbi:MAG: SDR family NAD(P)-dependent oxidoreductase [Candidatus Hydrogenedentes bacterium]|nr:SDR family NAD(P)-dependent oxidoreductase [Candidatus Hydrogenedentota bacterium]
MSGRFDGNVVFITGGSSGIGAALGRGFAKEGARVALAARHADRLDESVGRIRDAGGDAIPIVCDVRDRSSIDRAVSETLEAFGGIDVAIANAGFGVSGTFEALATDDYRRQFDTNVFGAIDTAYAALPALIASKGRLVFVSSVLGAVGAPTTSAYCASKFALCGFAESIYYELAEKGVSVTCINPGMVASNFRKVDNRGDVHLGRSESAPAWLVMDTDKAAWKMISAIDKRRFESTITLHGKVAVNLHRHFPRTVRFLVRIATQGRMADVERAKRGE